MEPIVINQLADRVAGLLSEKLGARGRNLEGRLAHARRELPRRVRRSGEALVAAQKMGANPKLAMRVDGEDVSNSYAAISRYLVSIDAAAVKSRKRFNLMASVAAQFLMVVGLLVAVLMWRGFI
jgi:septal ring factor EnvC (AmiA/AmiB activator)